MVRNPPYLTTFPNKSHKGTTFYKTAGEKADKNGIVQGRNAICITKGSVQKLHFPH